MSVDCTSAFKYGLVTLGYFLNKFFGFMGRRLYVGDGFRIISSMLWSLSTTIGVPSLLNRLTKFFLLSDDAFRKLNLLPAEPRLNRR